MTTKMTEPKLYLFIFNLENVVETSKDSFEPVTTVEINFCRLFCLMWEVFARSTADNSFYYSLGQFHCRKNGTHKIIRTR